ncbi:MerR family transcriptional regulator [Kordiimonas lacus]|uniref:MerR family transcriptional regulator, mercuric resistance operon regulatory protein n=1 Tax=Kordiimonas lacus TaxID=637679 RepID=A0A1G6UKE9_9PROT|nr:helix-turn-helix domain-containing protein [Kordiimonas lacus]SDD41832.1 MerR family transcriptional regulator, mercuric resistance operon regulatory protein [Kordiimonas lacus]
MTSSQKRDYTRGRLAKESGVNLETIRFYEKIGLMPDPPRTASGYRCYSIDHLKRLKFIRRSRELGFTNKEVRTLLEMMDGSYACDDVKTLALSHAGQIGEKIEALLRLKSALEGLAAECAGGETPDCKIIDHLYDL